MSLEPENEKKSRFGRRSGVQRKFGEAAPEKVELVSAGDAVGQKHI